MSTGTTDTSPENNGASYTIPTPLIIGLTGGTGSGKTTVANSIIATAQDDIVVLPQDMYYKDQSDLPTEVRRMTNYDQPNAFDTDLLVQHVDALIAGQAIERPVYDFSQDNRSEETVSITPKAVILIEGILVLHSERLRERMALKVFVDAPPDERFIRRLERDVSERNRSPESVIKQYRNTVKPMHDLFIEPTKQHADIIMPIGGKNKVALRVITSFIKDVLASS